MKIEKERIWGSFEVFLYEEVKMRRRIVSRGGYEKVVCW